jgi:hypothetical protein
MGRPILLLMTIASLASGAGDDQRWPEPDAERTRALTKELEVLQPGFTIARVGPWIVATDADAASTRSILRDLIGDHARRLQRQLFAIPRTEPVKVMLFKDKDSYESWNQKLYGEKPDTPYGYYSRSRSAMVMNIATGGGTLLHEMTHAMAEADYPAIPAWLNEGLGSLYEASQLGRDGRVRGMTNWRLPVLIAELDSGTAPAFADLLTLPDDAFYAEDRTGANYASARYLMQWLQGRGELEDFYARVRAGADGPTALRAAVGGGDPIEAIEKRVYSWARTLERR